MKAPCDATTGGGRDFCEPREEYGFVRARARDSLLVDRERERERKKDLDSEKSRPSMEASYVRLRAHLEQLTKKSWNYVFIFRVVFYLPVTR